MKKLFLMIAFTGMVASVSAASTFGDDKDKDKKKECKKDGKSCSGEKKECCKKDAKKSCCKKDAKVAVVGESPATPANETK